MNLDKNDHRSVGQRLDLFHFREDAPGMVFWHPHGFALYRALEEAVRRQCRAHGYDEVKSPQIMRKPVWEASGHWNHFVEGMFHVVDGSVPAAVKPVSCPGHIFVAARDVLSYRDLPLRLCELGVVHRDEPSGTLHGLLRVRQFTQDDGHVFCVDEAQAEDEVARFCDAVGPFYRAFGFEEVSVVFSTRPESRAGDDAQWDRSEAALRSVLAKRGIAHEVQVGGGAFYGPKLEFSLADRHGRKWQCGTIQFDLVMPERFDVRYVDRDGKKRRAVMIHRALYGSLERFVGILLEHYGAALPAWLAPLQAVVLPLSAEEEDGAAAFARRLGADGVRVETRAETSLARRIAECHELGVPHVVILGPREISSGKVTLRGRDGAQRVRSVDEAAAEIGASCATPEFS